MRDGPSRFWFSEGPPGEEGAYQAGRKIGLWRECDRFGRCHDTTYEYLHPQEKARGLKPELPLGYEDGKYVFNFHSCWSTWVTRKTPDSYLELNIVNGLLRCQVTYIPSVEKDRPAGNQGMYLCEIPFAVGVRKFDSLDVRKELPRIGLPQFCRQDDPGLDASGGLKAQSIAIWANTAFIDAVTKLEAHGWTTVANAVDVECAALVRPPTGTELLTVRLNEYAEQLVLERMRTEEVRADVCAGRFPFSPMKTLGDASGRTLFTFGLSRDRTTAARQRACITAQIKLQPTCEAN